MFCQIEVILREAHGVFKTGWIANRTPHDRWPGVDLMRLMCRMSVVRSAIFPMIHLAENFWPDTLCWVPFDGF